MKLNNTIKYAVIILVLIAGFSSCQSEYTKLVKKEIASGVTHDTLVFDMKFGDTKKHFFEQCWQLNKEGKVSHGPNNKYVQHVLHSNNSKNKGLDINMLFYGKFNSKNLMTGMDMEFSYTSWAPWNKELTAEKLIPVIKDTLLKWYPGNDFILVNLKEIDKETYVKVDGNRQILIHYKTTKDIVVKIENVAEKHKSKLE